MSEQDYSWGGSVTSNRRLFGSWLEETLKLQREYFGNDLPAMKGKQREAEVITQAYAAAEEIHEATSEVSWKPWAKSEYFNREAYIGELVDSLHFIANLLCIADCTDAELSAAYAEKMERNRERQRAGYTGMDKCDLCKRAVDDIVAHGGSVVRLENETICDNCWDKQ